VTYIKILIKLRGMCHKVSIVMSEVQEIVEWKKGVWGRSDRWRVQNEEFDKEKYVEIAKN
jgi:hypothetical protein